MLVRLHFILFVARLFLSAKSLLVTKRNLIAAIFVRVDLKERSSISSLRARASGRRCGRLAVGSMTPTTHDGDGDYTRRLSTRARARK